MSRQVQALGDPPAKLSGFPRWPLGQDRILYRAHSATNGPWWFASAHGTDRDGRFELADPYGTCYLAATANSAVRERWGNHLAKLRSVTGSMADDTRVSALRTPHLARLADTINSKAAQHGVTREIGTATTYALTQRWATAFHALGCGGIRYLPRFSTGPRDVAFVRVLDPPRSVKITTPPAVVSRLSPA